MTPSSGRMMGKVLWSEMFPYEIKQKIKECPVVYLPLGICEPHGQISAFGLDTIKAEWLCTMAASRVGGVVAPSQSYHIHETGYHARWLEDVIGETNPHMTSMPPHVVLHFFLYQLRAFVNSGFKAIIVISGHSGGNQVDLRRAAELFMQISPVRIWVVSDPELVAGQYIGDHAGKYEISQLKYLRPDLVNLPLHLFEQEAGSGGKFAVGVDAHDATTLEGEQIMHACLETVCRKAEELNREVAHLPLLSRLTYSPIETLWQSLLAQKEEWITSNPHTDQKPVSEMSQWKTYENFRI
ncbi:creatininase family protein [Paenibacillus roseipurpureus]|uniref:Creatininase family protein n=1 Tax=Paenibacillus roseopurpureus TaxID=2918901 RepID=A0AA96RK35_9BACL|nr:creatininase family protein [Paenibacillus sp. MBLB1832]WNR46023.1 creatininase family protein [Paenibacillus sp. MBLB1832]